MTIDVTIAAGRRYDLDDVYTIARERLFALDGPALETLHRAGWLASAFHVASSLGNLDALVAMKNARDGRS